jgi:hypothetical protein
MIIFESKVISTETCQKVTYIAVRLKFLIREFPLCLELLFILWSYVSCFS